MLLARPRGSARANERAPALVAMLLARARARAGIAFFTNPMAPFPPRPTDPCAPGMTIRAGKMGDELWDADPWAAEFISGGATGSSGKPPAAVGSGHPALVPAPALGGAPPSSSGAAPQSDGAGPNSSSTAPGGAATPTSSTGGQAPVGTTQSSTAPAGAHTSTSSTGGEAPGGTTQSSTAPGGGHTSTSSTGGQATGGTAESSTPTPGAGTPKRDGGESESDTDPIAGERPPLWDLDQELMRAKLKLALQRLQLRRMERFAEMQRKRREEDEAVQAEVLSRCWPGVTPETVTSEMFASSASAAHQNPTYRPGEHGSKSYLITVSRTCISPLHLLALVEKTYPEAKCVCFVEPHEVPGKPGQSEDHLHAILWDLPRRMRWGAVYRSLSETHKQLHQEMEGSGSPATESPSKRARVDSGTSAGTGEAAGAAQSVRDPTAALPGAVNEGQHVAGGVSTQSTAVSSQTADGGQPHPSRPDDGLEDSIDQFARWTMEDTADSLQRARDVEDNARETAIARQSEGEMSEYLADRWSDPTVAGTLPPMHFLHLEARPALKYCLLPAKGKKVSTEDPMRTTTATLQICLAAMGMIPSNKKSGMGKTQVAEAFMATFPTFAGRHPPSVEDFLGGVAERHGYLRDVATPKMHAHLVSLNESYRRYVGVGPRDASSEDAAMRQEAADSNLASVLEAALEACPQEAAGQTCFFAVAQKSWLQWHHGNGASLDGLLAALSSADQGKPGQPGDIHEWQRTRRGRRHDVDLNQKVGPLVLRGSSSAGKSTFGFRCLENALRRQTVPIMFNDARPFQGVADRLEADKQLPLAPSRHRLSSYCCDDAGPAMSNTTQSLKHVLEGISTKVTRPANTVLPGESVSFMTPVLPIVGTCFAPDKRDRKKGEETEIRVVTSGGRVDTTQTAQLQTRIQYLPVQPDGCSDHKQTPFTEVCTRCGCLRWWHDLLCGQTVLEFRYVARHQLRQRLGIAAETGRDTLAHLAQTVREETETIVAGKA